MAVRTRMAIPIACIVVALAAAMVPIASNAQVNVGITLAPPAPRFEAVPAARYGYVWAPGYWRWAGRAHVWVAGRWVPARRGMHWHGPEWQQRPNGTWFMRPGHWAH